MVAVPEVDLSSFPLIPWSPERERVENLGRIQRRWLAVPVYS